MDGSRSWKVRPEAGSPMAVIRHSPSRRLTLAMTWPVYAPPPASV